MAKERSVIASADIQAPPEWVWEVASDCGRYAEWVESTLEVRETDGPAHLGSTYEETTRISGPWKAVTKWRVTEFEPLQRQVHVGEGVVTTQGMAVIIELIPTDSGTHMTLTFRYRPRFGVIGTLINLGVEGSLRRAQQRSADAFANLAAREYANK
jgi:hypothetical protein